MKVDHNTTECPKCHSDWDGGSIVETFIKMRDEGYEFYAGKSDEQIEREVKGWPEEEILEYINSIVIFDLKYLTHFGYKNEDPLAFLLSLPTDKRNRYLTMAHDINVSGCYGPPYRWGRQIGVEDGTYDGVSWWQCPDCKTMWNRFTGVERQSINSITE